MAQFLMIKPNTHIPFMNVNKPITAFLFILAAASLLILLLPFEGTNPNWGTSFEGGTSITIHFNKDTPVKTEDVRKAFVNDPRFEKVTVQSVGAEGSNQYVVRTKTTTTLSCDKLDEAHKALSSAVSAQSGGNLAIGQWPVCNREKDNGIRGDFFVTLTVPEGKTAPETPISAASIEQALRGSSGQGLTAAVSYDESARRYLVKPTGIQEDVSTLLSNQFAGQVNPNSIQEIVTVGSDVGEKFRTDAIISILMALGLMLLYIGIRFDTRYAPSAVISLTVTVCITFGFVILTQLEFTLVTVAAFLSLVGYGINDTIVTFDRVRENVSLAEPDKPFKEVVSKSINDCLSRTIITSITTLVAILPMAILANGETRDFAIIMTLGICVATFDSIFISCPMLLQFDNLFKSMRKRSDERKAIDEITADVQ